MKRSITLVIALVCMVCASCARLDYESFNNYRIGGGHIDGAIEAIEIEWVRGNVDICYHDASTVEFYEDIHYADPDHNMFHWFDGRTLHLKFCSPYTSTAAVGKKTLTVLLPMESMCDLVEIETVSANINADLDSRRFRCETVSGDVSLLTLVNPSTIRIETVSGNVRLALPEDAGGSCNFDTVSGGVISDFPTAGYYSNFNFGLGTSYLDIETVSGNLSLMINRP